MSDLNALTSGNLILALRYLAPLSAADMKTNAQAAEAPLVMKAPWKYYGTIIRLTGQVGIVQDYPPGSAISKAFGGGEVGEVVIVTDDLTFIDYLQIGGTGNTKPGQTITIFGLPAGQVEVPNKLGGTTTQLVVVGKLIQ